MKYYAVVELNLKEDAWVPDYIKKVTQLVEQAGGKYLARTGNVEKIEGERAKPDLGVIIEFPSKEAVTTFYESAEYAPLLEQRKAGSQTELLLIAGEDVAKA